MAHSFCIELLNLEENQMKDHSHHRGCNFKSLPTTFKNQYLIKQSILEKGREVLIENLPTTELLHKLEEWRHSIHVNQEFMLRVVCTWSCCRRFSRYWCSTVWSSWSTQLECPLTVNPETRKWSLILEMSLIQMFKSRLCKFL